MVGLLSPSSIGLLCLYVRVCSGDIGFLFPPGFGTPDFTTRSPPKDIPCNSSAFSCSGRCGDDVHIPCSCDDDCQTYEDCCHDFKDVCNPSSEPLPLSMIRNSDCFETDTGLERFINRCPPGYSNATIRDKCHNDGWDAASTVDRIPVTDKATGLNYRNIFCAVCNSAKSPRGWEARVLCVVFPAVFDTLIAKIRAGLCETRVERPTDVGGRPCVMGAIQSCPNTSSTELAQECLAYTSYIRPVSQPLKIYANIHCYQCNNDLTPPGLDFERAAHNAVTDVFPGTLVRGCFFHFTQCIWRSVQKEGLVMAYKEDEEVKKLVRRAAALPLLPRDKVDDVWLHAIADSPAGPKVTAFMDYVTTSWVQGGAFMPEIWNHFENQGHRTNNHLEGWSEPSRRKKYKAIDARIASLKIQLLNQHLSELEYADHVGDLLHLQ
ncbi:uncharacterized protein LOC124150077 [Haliotis rufescens]|uniref:uncharacterized protein LOC124150077 n=1 Tax=Haliotis rufescens TaxID=6454 RepID=UPI00201F2CC2|nr:uncharacterized protein LOC124150077 [Haliotis rufescens]